MHFLPKAVILFISEQTTGNLKKVWRKNVFALQYKEIRRFDGMHHKVHTFKEYHSVCPLVGIGILPTPLSPASVPLPPEPRRGTLACGRGVGGVPIPTTGEKA
jgi:hypothetical protein